MSDTPETNAAIMDSKGAWSFQLREKMESLERERDLARNDIENLKACAVHSCHKDCQRPGCKARRENKSMREAIQEVNKILQSIQLNDIFEETMRNHATYALAKLKPFLSESPLPTAKV